MDREFNKFMASQSAETYFKKLKSGNGLMYCRLFLTLQLFNLLEVNDDVKIQIMERMEKCKTIKGCENLFRQICLENITIKLN